MRLSLSITIVLLGLRAGFSAQRVLSRGEWGCSTCLPPFRSWPSGRTCSHHEGCPRWPPLCSLCKTQMKESRDEGITISAVQCYFNFNAPSLIEHVTFSLSQQRDEFSLWTRELCSTISVEKRRKKRNENKKRENYMQDDEARYVTFNCASKMHSIFRRDWCPARERVICGSDLVCRILCSVCRMGQSSQGGTALAVRGWGTANMGWLSSVRSG